MQFANRKRQGMALLRILKNALLIFAENLRYLYRFGWRKILKNLQDFGKHCFSKNNLQIILILIGSRLSYLKNKIYGVWILWI